MFQLILSIIILFIFIPFFVVCICEIGYDDVTYFFYEKLRNKINSLKNQKNFYKRIYWLKKLLRRKSARQWLTIDARNHYENCRAYKSAEVPIILKTDADYKKAALVWALTSHRHLFTKKELKIIDKCGEDIARRVPNWREFFNSVPTEGTESL